MYGCMSCFCLFCLPPKFSLLTIHIGPAGLDTYGCIGHLFHFCVIVERNTTTGLRQSMESFTKKLVDQSINQYIFQDFYKDIVNMYYV